MTLSLTKRIAGGMIGLFVGTVLALAAPLTYAQTPEYGTTTTTTRAPGVPSTGEGGNAGANFAVLGISALALLAGGTYLARTKREA